MSPHFDPAELRNEKGEWTSKQIRDDLKANHPISPDNIVSMWQQASDDEKHEGENWYPSAGDMADMMSKKYGLTKHQAAGIIAVYSPQTPWGTNLMRAATVMRTRHAVGGKGSGIMATAKQKDLAQRILNGEDYDNLLKGRKINNFAHLIEQGGDKPGEKGRVVVDRHAIGVARGIAMTEDQYGVDAPSSAKRYEQFSDAYRQAADKISKIEGRTIAPHQVQAATWLARQRLNKTNNKGRSNTRGARDWSDWLNFAGKEGLSAGDAGVGYELSIDWEFESLKGDTIDLAAPQVSNVGYAAQPERGAQQVHTVTPPPQDDNLVRDIALILAADATLKAQIAGITTLLAPLGVQAQAVQAALGLANGGTSHRPNARLARNGLRAAKGQVSVVRDNELYFRAAYVLNSAHRLQQSLNEGKTIRAALSEESPYYRAHEKARAGRQDAAAQVSRMADVFGPLLGWYLNPLRNNEPECIAADGHNFYADQGTVIGLPGSVHPNCGCTAGPPIEGADLVNNVLGNVIRFGSSKKLHKLKRVHTA